MEIDAEFWAIVALLIFIGVLIYIRVPGMITGILDRQIKKIEDELAEAARLRSEAEALLKSYAGKAKEAETEAAGILAAARDEADRMAKEAAAALEQLIARRTKAVEEKIAQAEQQALAEVRGRSADVAVEAARVILENQMATKGEALVSQAIKDVAAKLH
ncbi:MAG TPA: ATP F0F1 synthase subunit B [Devosiaceae bacterium]|jgi:F-type H+-transporting ATPase subunit b|nr:ATP F0F1 synthase subunit B [Devosiaceae bacterium]